MWAMMAHFAVRFAKVSFLSVSLCLKSRILELNVKVVHCETQFMLFPLKGKFTLVYIDTREIETPFFTSDFQPYEVSFPPVRKKVGARKCALIPAKATLSPVTVGSLKSQ